MQFNGNGACLSRVRAGIQRASKSATRIGRFVLGTPLRIRSMSISDLAKASANSPATVHRFCKDLGYSGYREFQLDLAASVTRDESVNLEDLVEGSSPRSIVHRVFEYHRQSLVDTEELVDIRLLARIAKLIQRSRKVLLLGSGASGFAAGRAADLLLNLGYTAIAVVDPYSQIFATENVGPGDVVVGISHTGQTSAVIEGIQAAGARGARTVCLTNYRRSPLARASEFHLITALREHRINAAVSSSVPAQLCLLSSICFVLAGWGGKKAMQMSAEAEQRVQRTLRSRVVRKGT